MSISRFWIWCGLGAFAVGLVFAVTCWQLASREELAAQRNDYIDREIKKLKLEIAEIEDLGDIRALYDAMARAASRVQQHNVVYAAEALAELSRLPRQIVLTRANIDGNRITLTGEAFSESDLARLQPTLEQRRFVTKVRVAEALPLGGKHRFRAEGELAVPPTLPAAPAEKSR